MKDAIVHFDLEARVIDTSKQRARLQRADAGAFVCFEGWVRNYHEGKVVRSLHYSAHPTLALSEGRAVLEGALSRFQLNGAICIHRLGHLQVSELAVWVGVVSGHREAAFAGCRHIIDTIKARVPIWKHEHYELAEPQWLHETPAETE